MDRTKVFRKIVLGLIAFAAILCPFSTALAAQKWVTLTSFKDVRRMRVIHDSLYVATSGGLLVIGDSSEAGRRYTNLDGLGTVDLTDIMVDATGQTWITGAGRLVKFGSNQEPYLFFDNDNQLFRLLCVVDDGDYLWIGSELGLILFSKKQFGGEIEDSYTMFGTLNPSPAVQGILLDGDSIWVATSAGLAVTDRRDRIRMKSPASWTTFSINNNPELGSSDFNRIVSFESNFYVATSNGAFRLDRSVSDTTFVPLQTGRGADCSDLQVANDSLFLYTADGLAVWSAGSVMFLPATGLSGAPQTGLNNGQYRWVGLRTGGICQNSSGSFVPYSFTGLPSNSITDLTVDRTGQVTAMLGHTGVAQLRPVDGAWITRSVNVGSNSTVIISDSSNNQWAGTFGNGLWRISSDTVKKFDISNSTLRGNSDANGSNYIVVNGLATDGRYLFAGCYRAFNNYPISFCDLDSVDVPSAWDSLGVSDGIGSSLVSSVDYENGNLVMGTVSGGLYWCYLGANPRLTRADSCHYMTQSNAYYLRSDAVRKVKFAPDGSLWVGTNFGLSHYDYGIDRFADVNLPAGIEPDVTGLDFDSRGNMFVSAHNGLARFDATAGTFEIMTSLNSGLVADDINGITLDKRTGNLWVATNSGISMLTSAIANPTQRLDSVFAFPDPYIVSSATDYLKFNYTLPGSVRIFDVSGALIAELSVNSYWDGRNQKGRNVASGVYLFVLTGADGRIARGKFLLINKR